MTAGHNLAPTPRFTGADRGMWEAGTPAERDGAGYSGGVAYRLGVPSIGVRALALPLPGETWQPGAAYTLTARTYRSSTTAITIAIGPSDGRDFTPYGINLSYGPSMGHVHVLTQAPTNEEEWLTVHTELTCDPAAEFEDELGSPLDPIGQDLYLYLIPNTANEFAQAVISHVRIDYAENDYGTGYFDGDGLSPSDTEPGPADATYGWSGAPFLSASTATLPAGPDPEDPDPEDPGPEDPGPEDPDPEDPDPWDLYETIAERLAPKAAAFAGRPDDEPTIATARAQLPVVIEYVRGYTRGRGFDTGLPAGPLRAVIVSAVSRLIVNPEQLTYYSVGDYSERPAVLAGWTLAELGVLRRYRRTTA